MTDSTEVRQSRLRRMLLPTWERRKRSLYVQTWVLVVGSYGLLAFAVLFPHDFRQTGTLYLAGAWLSFMVRTFLFHHGLLLALVAGVAAWRRCWRLAAVAAPLVLATLGPTLWQWRPKAAPSTRGETLTVMSVNLLNRNQTPGPILAEITAADPDVLLLQEYTPHWHRAVQAAVGSTYPHQSWVIRDDSYGLAVYSRRPFVEPVSQTVALGDATEPQIRAVIELAGQNVTLYNLHLTLPLGLDYLAHGRREVADLLDLLMDRTGPVLIAGDFNFTEHSPQAAALARAGMTDAQSRYGVGRGATWPVNSFLRWLPGLRLDHIYLSEPLVCTAIRTGQGYGSDHRPVVATIAMQP